MHMYASTSVYTRCYTGVCCDPIVASVLSYLEICVTVSVLKHCIFFLVRYRQLMSVCQQKWLSHLLLWNFRSQMVNHLVQLFLQCGWLTLETLHTMIVTGHHLIQLPKSPRLLIVTRSQAVTEKSFNVESWKSMVSWPVIICITLCCVALAEM